MVRALAVEAPDKCGREKLMVTGSRMSLGTDNAVRVKGAANIGGVAPPLTSIASSGGGFFVRDLLGNNEAVGAKIDGSLSET